mgnify:CR=1 FL=1
MTEKNTKKTEFRQVIKEHSSYLYAVLVISVFSAALPLAPIVYMRLLFGPVLYSDSIANLAWVTFILVAALTLGGVLEWVRQQIFFSCSVSISNKLDKRVFNSVFTEATENWIDGAKVLSNLRTIRIFMTSPPMGAIFDVPLCFIFLILIFFIHPYMGVMSLLGAVLALIFGLVTEKKVTPHLEDLQKHQNASRQELNSSFKNVQTAVSMGIIPNIYKKWKSKNDRFLISQAQASAAQAAGGSGMKFALALQGSMILGVGATLMILELIPARAAGNLIVAKFIGALAVRPLMVIVMQWQMVVAAKEAYKNVENFLEKHPKKNKTMPMSPPIGKLEVSKMEYSTHGKNNNLVENINFRVDPGQLLTIMGMSGAGKTTLARLLVGFLNPTNGSVRLDGVSIFPWDKTELGKYIGYLPQDIELFDGSLADNITRFGDRDYEQLEAAVKLANLNTFVNSLPDGLETNLNTDMMKIPGGIKQKIGIARAIYGNPKLIVLDEPTSNMDSDSEKHFLDSIRKIKSLKSTIVLITHSKAILSISDLVLTLENGEQKTFDTLQNLIQKMKIEQEKKMKIAKEKLILEKQKQTFLQSKKNDES